MRSFALLLVLVALVGEAAAHIDHTRPSIQGFEAPRTVEMRVSGLDAKADLVLTNEPLRQLITHTAAPRGLFLGVAHRPDLSSSQDEAAFRWELTRLVEYRDANGDARFDEGTEPVARQWRFASYGWSVSGIRNVTVGGAAAKDVLWTGSIRGGPNASVEVAAAGAAFSDEGARVRSQDIIVYLSFTGFPERGVGNLYALEGRLVAPRGAAVETINAQNATVGVYGHHADRRGFFVWGGEALLRGAEKPVEFSMEAPSDDGANLTRVFRLHMPIFDGDARFVLVSGIEYDVPTGRQPLIPALPLWALLAGALLSVWMARRG